MSKNSHTSILAGIDCESYDGMDTVWGVVWHEEPPETSCVPVVRRFNVAVARVVVNMVHMGDVMPVDDHW